MFQKPVSSLAELTFEDAARYIWLAGLPARSMLAKADELRDVAKDGDLAMALAPHIDPNWGRRNRALADSVWRNWFKWSQQEELADGERRRFAVLQLNQPRAETDAALAIRDTAETKRSGDSSTVILPVLDFPLRLSDAILILPGLMLGLLLLIWVYLVRGRQYAPTEKVLIDGNHLMVGKIPVFLLGIRHNELIGKYIAIYLVLLPILVTAVLWWFFLPPVDWTSPVLIAYCTLVFLLSLLFFFLISKEIHKICVLYVKEIIALGLPPLTGVSSDEE